MAASGCSPMTFLCTCESAFYFEVTETDGICEEDNFNISNQCCKQFIRSNNNKYLLLNDEGQFQAQNLTTKQLQKPDCKFDIQIYQTQGGRKTRAVMLYANKDGKKMVACCNDKHEIYPEVMDLPHKIEETAHKALFYLMGLAKQTNKYMFESSLYPNEFLGFEPTMEDPSLDRLVLRSKGEDEVDESCEVSF